MNRRTAFRLAAGASLAAALVTSGCGQKGPLFLPEEKLDELERKRDARTSTTGSLEPAPGPTRRV